MCCMSFAPSRLPLDSKDKRRALLSIQLLCSNLLQLPGMPQCINRPNDSCLSKFCGQGKGSATV